MDNLVSIFMETKLKNKARPWLVDKFNNVYMFFSGLNSGYVGAGITIVMNRSLAKHVYKVSKANEINSLIVRAINEFFFVIFGGDFNEDGSYKCTSFKKCYDLGLVNSLGVAKTIDYVFCNVFVVSEHFNTDHRAVFGSLDLGGLLNTRLNSLCKQNNFKSSMLANATMFSSEFAASMRFLDLDAMWCVVCKVMTLLANEIFKKKWFKRFDKVFTKESSKFYKLKLLVSRIVKALCGENAGNFVYLMKCWSSVDSIKFFVVQNLVDSGASSDRIHSALFGAKKSYHASKLTESLRAKKTNIRSAINKRMESFEVNKSHIIKSVLECLFCKVVLDYLMVNDDLILEPSLVKSKTKKCHVADDVFSDVMCPIGFDEFFEVVSDLFDSKAAVCSEYAFGNFEPLSGVLTNICPIALIKTAHKIFFKIFSDRIFSAYSVFDVFCGDNFLFPIFAIGLVVEDALKKDQELWLVLIKMCSKFIHFFGNIHNNHTNQIITDFSLMDGYHVHDGLDQREVFSPLLWQIFYDSLLCEVKRQESVCEYRLNSYFISKNSHAKSWARCSFFFAAGAFVDDMIWVGSSQSATQHILNIASEFFWINNISINNDKTVVIPINSKVSNPSLSISGLPISITKKGESYRYLGIFLSTEGFFKPSLVKVHLDVHFFTNLVLKKAVSNKQFLYLVLAVFYPIVNYRIQFSFVSVGLKLKSDLPLDFSSNTIHHPSFYGLKSFSQCQSESKIALLVCFANSGGILGCLFTHVCVNVSNNFLAGMIHILFDCKLFLGGSLASSFQFHSRVLMSVRLDPHGSVPEWFELSVAFFMDSHSSPLALAGVGPLDICGSNNFVSVCDWLSQVGANSLSVYTDGLLKNLGIIGYRARAAGLVLSTLIELQAIALALKCMSAAYSVYLFSNSQMALNACKSESDLVCSDFCNQYWVKCQHIKNVICSKNLRVKWHKVKGHSGILGNDYTDSFINAAFLSGWYLPSHISEHFLLADGGVVSGNSRHFVYDVFCAICYVRWEVSFGSGFLDGDLHSDINWLCSSRVWHPNLHMATGFTSRLIADTRTYFIKALHCWLPMAVQKRIYNKCYPSVLCLYCGEVEVSNHVFSYVINDSAHHQVLESCMSSWKVLSGFSLFSSSVLQLLSTCALDFPVSSALYKSFVFNGWLWEAISVFYNPKVAGIKIADFIQSICLAFRNDIWLVCVKHCVFMEKNDLILVDGLIPISVSGLVSGIGDLVSVIISP
ncbi:hypothetical protein G9A89_010838 [Geosiphon pyriformis]|nr:hypothetical protein G9A89_010838 [Geosiphon pyriformis]